MNGDADTRFLRRWGDVTSKLQLRTGLRSEEKASLFTRGKEEGMMVTVGRQGVLEKVLLPLWHK